MPSTWPPQWPSENREGRQSEVERNNDMRCQSIRGCNHNDAHLCLNTQVLASITAKKRDKCIPTHKRTRTSFVDAGGFPWRILDTSSWQPPISWLTQSSAVAKISGLRSSPLQPQALMRRINSAQRSGTGNVFSAGSGGNVVTTRETPMSRYASKDQH